MSERRTEENTARKNTARANRAVVERALAGLVTTGDVGALAPLLRDDFAHHRPEVGTRTKDEWLAGVGALPLAALRVEITHVVAEGDLVVMHTRRWLDGGGPGILGVDIWRLEDGLIVEGWEVIEPVADAAAHWEWWRPAS
ncbi:nuclear transport factor 2 family protein [Streptomyces triticirhizae]|uniref:Nuclear transport factor 2 family protein n=1 Tax=Streptomyces triticirhizae TaxID=2483353 RepID=A0A3M2M1X4_9ACTN|nr:nuclear transport factor 2 family protein [Streptomyces triticirhizae]RMI43617.1 nuclear transport factor 2 family protein [Streptomyces triticirhizae]